MVPRLSPVGFESFPVQPPSGRGGIHLPQMQSDDPIRITRSPQCLKLIQPPKKSYFEILRNKLKWDEV